MSKSKKSILSGIIALLMLLALSVSTLTGLTARADDPITAADFVTGGTAYTPATVRGSSEYKGVAVSDVANEVHNNAGVGYPATYTVNGIVLTATQALTQFNLGTYDLSSMTTADPVISFLPWIEKKADSRTSQPNANYTNFKITFSNGEKSFAVRSYTAVDSGELGIGAAGENQSRYVGWAADREGGGYDPADGTAKPNLLMYKLDGTYYGLRGYMDAATVAEDGKFGSSLNPNSKRYMAKPVGIYIENSQDDFWVYTDIAAAGGYYNANVVPGWFNNVGRVVFGESGSQYARYKVRNLTEIAKDGNGATIGNGVAWTPFAEDELKNVNITIELEGVTAESKFVVTKIAGKDVNNSINVACEKAGVTVTDGVARTLTPTDNTLTVNKKIVLSDNDALTPLATVALFPKEYGTEKSNVVNDTSSDEYATQDAKNKRDVESVNIDFESASGKYFGVQLGFRKINDNADMPTSFRVRASKNAQYEGVFVGDSGEMSGSHATRAASSIRFDGFVSSNNESNEDNVKQLSFGIHQDPVYSIYYDAATNALYSDSGRTGKQTVFGTKYRWLIADLDDLEFAGFGNEEVTMSVSADVKNKEGSEASAHVMIMNVDGYSVKYDTDGNIDPAGAPTSKQPIGLSDKSVVLGADGTADITIATELKVYNMFSGWVNYTDYTVAVTDPQGAAVTVTDNKFTANKVGTYTVKYTKDGTTVGQYTVKTGLGLSSNQLVAKFSKVGTALDEIETLTYDQLPDYMNFEGGAIMVESKNAANVNASSHYYTWGGRGDNGSGVTFNDAINLSNMTYTSAAEHDTLVKLAFPGADADHAKFSQAITYRVNLYDAADESKFIAIFIQPGGNDLLFKAIGSWENPGRFELLREASWSNDDGSIVIPVNQAGQSQPAWQTGKKLPGVKASGVDGAPVELSFDYATGRLYAISGTNAILVRDFVKGTLLSGSYFPGFTGGEIKLTVGVDMPNYRMTDATVTQTALYTKFAVMGIAGVDFTADADGNIVDKVIATFDPDAIAGDAITVDAINFGTVLTGVTAKQDGKIAVTRLSDNASVLDECDFTEDKTIAADKVTAGSYKLTYTAAIGTFEIPFKIDPALAKPEADAISEHVTVYLDGVDVSTLAAKTAYVGEHTVSVQLDAGYEIDELTVAGQTLTLTSNAAKFSYVNGTVPSDVFSIAATTKPINYNITYNKNYTITGLGTDYTQTFTVEDTTITVPTPTLTTDNDFDKKYAFDGWYSDGIKVVNGEYKFGASDMTLEARFIEKTYTLTLNFKLDGVDNGSLTYTFFNKDTKLAALETIAKNTTTAGKIFMGWFTDADCSTDNAFDVNTVDDGATLYAKYEDGKTVTFGEYGVVTVAAGATVADADVITPVKAGHAFAGWYTDVTCTSAWNASTAISDDVTLYAKWTKNKYTVTVWVGDAKTTINDVEYGTPVSALTMPTIPDKANHTKSWSMAASDLIEGDVTIVAVYTPGVVTVTFNSDGGSAVDALTFAYGEAIVAPVTDPVKQGYTFAGWYNGDTEYVFGAEATADVTLTAKWIENATDEQPAPDVKDEKEGCAKEAVGMLALVLSALGATLIIKKRG